MPKDIDPLFEDITTDQQADEMEWLYEYIEIYLHQIEMELGDAAKDNGTYDYFCWLLEEYDEGNRTLLFFYSMREIYKLTDFAYPGMGGEYVPDRAS